MDNEESKIKEILSDILPEIICFMVELITGGIVGIVGVGILYLVLCGANALGVNYDTLILLWHIGCISSTVFFGLGFLSNVWMAQATSFATFPGIFLGITIVNGATLFLNHPAFVLSIS